MSNYKIINDDKYMFLVLNNNKELHYTEYDQELKDILEESFSTACIRYDNRIRLEKEVNYKRYYYLWYHIIFCYYYRGLNKKNVHSTLQNFSYEIKTNKMVIDHLDNNKANNCKCNLSLIARSANSSKMNTNKKFNNMFHIDKSFDGKKYRILFTYISKNRKPKIKSLKYMCDNIEDLNNLCKYLQKNKWSIRDRVKGTDTPKELFSIKTVSILTFSPFVTLVPLKQNTEIQEILNSLPFDNFENANNILNIQEKDGDFNF